MGPQLVTSFVCTSDSSPVLSAVFARAQPVRSSVECVTPPSLVIDVFSSEMENTVK